MATEIASLLVTAEAQTGDAEKALDRLGIKFDNTVDRMRGGQGRFVSFADANKLAAKEIKNHADAIEGLRGRLETGARDLQRFGTILTASVTLPLVAASAAATKFAGDLQSKVSLIRTIRPDFDASNVFDKLSKLQTVIPQTSDQLGEASYNIVSSLDDIGEAATLNLTEKFGKGATAARVDALQFGTAILGVLNAYKLKVEDVDRVQDLFFQTVNRGIITGHELSNELAGVSKAAQNAGVDFDTLFALVVGATKEAGPAAENMTQLSQVLNQFTAKDAQEGLTQLGIKTHDARGQFLPFISVLEQVKEKYDKLSQVDQSKLVQGLFPDIRSQKGFATLLRQLDTVKAAKNDPAKAGSAERAFETVAQTFNFQFEIFKNTVRHAFESIGAELLPVLIPFVKAFGQLIVRGVQFAVNAWKELPGGVKAGITALLGLAAAAGPVLVVLGTLAAAVLSVAGSIGAMGTAIAAAGGLSAIGAAIAPAIPPLLLAAGAFAAVAAAAVAAAAAIYKAWTTNFLGIRDLTFQAWGAIKTFVKQVWDELRQAYALIMPELVTITRNVLGTIQAFWDAHGAKVVAAVRLAWEIITTVVRTAVRIIASLIAGVLAVINGDWQKVWDMAIRVVESFVAGFGKLTLRIDQTMKALIVFLLLKAVQMAQAGTTLALKFVNAMIAELWLGAPRIAAAVLGIAAMLSSPAVLAAYAASGAAAARARNQAFQANLVLTSVTGGASGSGPVGVDASIRGSGFSGPNVPDPFAKLNLPGAGNGGGGGGGENKAKKLYRLQIQDLETAVGAIERLNQRALADADYFYSEGMSKLESYVAAKRQAADRLYEAETKRDTAELAALRASGLRGKEREVEENKIADKMLATKQRHETSITELERFAAAERKAIQRASFDGNLEALQEYVSGFESIYSRMAEQGVLSFATAQRAIDGAQLELLLAQKVGIERQLDGVVEGTRKFVELSTALDVATQRIANFRAQMTANLEDANRRDADVLRNHARTIASIWTNIADIEISIQRDRLRLLEQMGASKEFVWRREMEIDLQAAEAARKRRVADLIDQRTYIEQTEKNEQRRLELVRAVNAQIAAEEKRGAQDRESIVGEFYEKQRQRLRDFADRAVGSLKQALDRYKKEGLSGFFASLGESFRDTLEQMALDLLKSRVLSLLQTVFKIPQVGSGGGPGTGTSPTGQGGSGIAAIIGQIFGGVFGGNSNPNLSQSAAITQAGRDSVAAIDSAGQSNSTAVNNTGKATSSAIITAGQGVVSVMTQILSMMANSNTRGSFWKGLLMAAAGGAVNGAVGQVFSGGTIDLGGGSTYTPGGTGSTRPRTVNTTNRAFGGMVYGPGTSTSDSIFAMLSNGEGVVTARAAAYYGGSQFIDAINSMRLPRYGAGGIISSGRFAGYRSGGMVSGGGGGVNHYHMPINVHAKDSRGVEKSAREVRRQALLALRDADSRTGR